MPTKTRGKMSTWLFSVILALAILNPLQASSCCHDGWVMYKDSCYLFADEQKLDWNEAVSFCRLRNSYLVSIETEQENRFVKYFASKLFKIDYFRRNITAFWTGASDIDIEGIWKWVSTDSELSYTAWNADGCQSKQNTDVDNNEDCLALNGAYNFCWSDGLCNAKVGYALCETNVSKGNSTGVMIIG